MNLPSALFRSQPHRLLTWATLYSPLHFFSPAKWAAPVLVGRYDVNGHCSRKPSEDLRVSRTGTKVGKPGNWPYRQSERQGCRLSSGKATPTPLLYNGRTGGKENTRWRGSRYDGHCRHLKPKTSVAMPASRSCASGGSPDRGIEDLVRPGSLMAESGISSFTSDGMAQTPSSWMTT
jgi:hypothetical protein